MTAIYVRPPRAILANRVVPQLSEGEVAVLANIQARFPPIFAAVGSFMCAEASSCAEEVLTSLDLTLEVTERLGIGQVPILNVSSPLISERYGPFRLRERRRPAQAYHELHQDAQRVWDELVNKGYEPFIVQVTELPGKNFRVLLCVQTSHAAFSNTASLPNLK